ncbi:MAG: GDSL-type esterase/lipase family protein [Candidatus Erginobacter occultus]|nr:GDSL-type esterase/lipase family protein [Candidatus Erginobacter occultus]
MAMKNIGFLSILSIFICVPGSLYPEDAYFIGQGQDPLDPGITFRICRQGTWEEADFPPAERFEGNYDPALALGPDGEVWVVWAAREVGEKPKIYFSRRRGAVWTEPRRINRGEDYWEMTPAIAVGPEGTVMAAWSGERDDNSAIYCARWEGEGFGRVEVVSSPERSPVLHPALAVATGGRALLFWQGWDGEYYRLFFSLYENGKWQEEEPLAGGSTVDETLPAVNFLGGGNWECLWVERGNLLSAERGPLGWSNPAPAENFLRENRPDAGEPLGAGWVAERDSGGTIRSRRVGVTFDGGLKITTREAKSGLGNREFIGYGDSITYGTDEKNHCYIPLLEADLQASHGADYTIHNQGYPGTTTENLLVGGGYPEWYCPGISVVIAGHNASHILIMAGTNDVRSNISPATSQTHLGAMIDRARAAGCEPVLATIIPVYYKWPDRYNRTEILNRDYILPLAQAKNCLLADPFQAYLDYGNWRNLLIDDGIHPVWEEGSQVIADAWFDALYIPPRLDSGDYNGDGRAEFAVFRPASCLWAIRNYSRIYFGSGGDTPASGDYDGDGTTDVAVFRDSTGLWAVRGVTRLYFGRAGDVSVPGDYDGNGTCDPSIFRPSTGYWAVRGITRLYFGGAGDVPVPGYFQGRAAKDIGIFRRSSGFWAVRNLTRFYFGRNGDQPACADYPGDGEDRYAVFRPTTGLWAEAASGTRSFFGGENDRPCPAPYSGNGQATAAVFGVNTGRWAVQGLTRLYFGKAGDIPVAGRVP